jgi:hypothetical protein
MEKNSKMPTVATTAILTVITIFFWIGFEVYRALSTKPTPTVPVEILSQIDPTLDQNALNTLPGRLELSSEEVGNVTITAPTPIPTLAPTETPIPTASPVATSSASPNPTPTATP